MDVIITKLPSSSWPHHLGTVEKRCSYGVANKTATQIPFYSWKNFQLHLIFKLEPKPATSGPLAVTPSTPNARPLSGGRDWKPASFFFCAFFQPTKGCYAKKCGFFVFQSLFCCASCMSVLHLNRIVVCNSFPSAPLHQESIEAASINLLLLLQQVPHAARLTAIHALQTRIASICTN